jgi:hypothetical protein
MMLLLIIVRKFFENMQRKISVFELLITKKTPEWLPPEIPG